MLKLNNEIIEECNNLIYSIVKKYCNDYNKEDLYQAGMLGLIKASENYDENLSSAKFSSFAYKSILGEILKYLREDRNIKIGRDIIKDYKIILKAKEHIYQTYGKNISNKELSKLINIKEDRINEVLTFNQTTKSLNKVITEDDKDITLEDTIASFETYNEEYIDLKDAIYSLDEEERKLIIERYYENKSQTEIAKERNISQVKVYRLERKILDKMKDKVA